MKEDSFTVDGSPLVSIVEHHGDVKASIESAVKLIGGWEKLLSGGETVLVKPNFNGPNPPPAGTDPEFLRAVIELLYAKGAGKVVVGEASNFARSARRMMEKTGALRAAQEAGAEVVFFEHTEHVTLSVPGRYLKSVRLPNLMFAADRIVYLPCLKTHSLADFSISLKLPVGFMLGTQRIAMHLSHLKEKVAELNTVLRPDLIILDARKCFIKGGPDAGEVRDPGLVLASGSRVALDLEGLRILRAYPECSLNSLTQEPAQMRRAIELGIDGAGSTTHKVVTDGSTSFTPQATGS